MHIKLAWGNVRRSVRDYAVYFVTLGFAACLMYTFIASTDYLLALDLTPDQRSIYARSGGVLQAFSVFIVIVFIFLVAYANRFIVRRRKREFGLYALLGMGRASVGVVLALEGMLVGAAALVAGITAGVLLSPAFGAVAAFIFAVPYRVALVFSADAASWTAGCFAVITVLAAAACVRDVLKRPLVELMAAERTPESLRGVGRGARRAQGLIAAVLLAVVWGSCVCAPGIFMVFIIPMGFAACAATCLVFRILAVRIPERMRRRRDAYWSGLVPFTVRQLEARVSSSATALACVCVLIAAGVCMTVAGLVFSVGMRGSSAPEAAEALSPIGYVGVFYGATFFVAAAAVLALQQLSGAPEARRAYRVLDELGTPRDLARSSLRAQVLFCFFVPVAAALVHDVFGLALVLFLAVIFGSGLLVPIAAGTLATMLGIMAVYAALTFRSCERSVLGFRRGAARRP